MLSTSEVEKGIAAGESCAADNQMLARAEVEKGGKVRQTAEKDEHHCDIGGSWRSNELKWLLVSVRGG